jgi:hypothetical protein
MEGMSGEGRQHLERKLGELPEVIPGKREV